jgi:hypothetical protein
VTAQRRALEAAIAYAAANGYSPDDRRAAGLVLAGMALAAALPREAAAAIEAEYRRTFPDAPLDHWVAYITGVRT